MDKDEAIYDCLDEMMNTFGVIGMVVYDYSNEVQRKAIINSINTMDTALRKLRGIIDSKGNENNA